MKTTRRNRSAAEIIAFHFGWDIGEVRDARYQPGVYGGMGVYTIDDWYLCCPPGKEKPLYSKTFPWKPFAEHYDRVIYSCTVAELAKHQGF
jgi:hypothetical protein